MPGYITNERVSERIPLLENFTEEKCEKVNRIHNLIPGFEATPLVSLDSLSEKYGAGKIFVKDESYRLGLNSFKSLGAGYAAIRYLSEYFGIDESDISLGKIRDIASDKNITLITATDGNHGKAVAFIARSLGMKSIVYMPKGSSVERFDAIKEQGADCYITDVNYDGAVLMAKKEAEEHGYIFVQDTAMPGYEEIPLYIMQGYTNIIREAKMQMGDIAPTHVFLQAGVGSFASSILAFMVNEYENYPKTVILEPENANCVYMSAKEGRSYEVTGDLDTIMAGLSCGVASSLALEVLLRYADMYVSVEDDVAEKGMRILYHPVGDDKRIISGESGAVGTGFLHEVMNNPAYGDIKDILGINKDSVILIISTEGDTDRESFKNITAKGKVL